MIWADSESCGLVGPTFTLQWARDEGPVRVHHIWHETARETLRILDRMVGEGVGFWNATHDWFHVQRLHNILSLLPQSRPPTIQGWCRVEVKATDGPCVKPSTCLDLFLHARRGPMQSLMDRKDVRIRRVPSALAPLLAEHLTKTIKIDGVYFTRRREGYAWVVEGEPDDPEFPDVVLKFGASGGLKPLARHLLGVKAMDFPMPDDLYPDEAEWNPFGRDWLRVFERGKRWWRESADGLKYAADDVILMRKLWHHFGCPPPGDTDSLLACQVGSSRWRGYAVNRTATEILLDEAEKERDSAPRDWRPVLAGLHERMSAVERLAVADTRGETLDEIAGVEGKAGWVGGWTDNKKARDYARRVVKARSADKLVDYCGKLLAPPSGRGHPSFRITATLSDRMGGSGGFNWQGLPGSVKKLLTMAHGGLLLDGGDFWAFEVTLMAAIWKDEQLITDLRSGKKIHALFGSAISGMSYDDIYDDETEHAIDKDAYDRFKRGFFGKSMGAQTPKLAKTIFPMLTKEAGETKVDLGVAEFERRYPGVGAARKRIADAFCSMRQVGGLGSRVEWHEPAEKITSLFGSERFFTLENRICRELFKLANSLPGEFRRLRIKIRRRDRLQTPGGAAQSAIFAAAFNVQARAMRAAANHEIQASGARITKELQGCTWQEQPWGIHPWKVQPLNEHDSLMIPTHRDLTDVVAAKVEEFRPTVPLIRMDWKHDIANWGDK